MASEPFTSSVPAPPPLTQRQPLQAWLARLGLSGKLLAIGGLVGVIAVFLPLVSIQMQAPNTGLFGARGGASVPAFSVNQTIMVVRDFRGMICLFGYLAALGLAYVLYAPTVRLDPKTFGWVGLGVGGFIALLALWLVLGTLSGSGSIGGFGGGLSISVGSGAILNLLAAAAVAAGGVLKAREEKLF
jgi:hypothetical protein